MEPDLRFIRIPAAATVLAALLTTGVAIGALAQVSSDVPVVPAVSPERPDVLTITTDYPAVTVAAGEEARFPLVVNSPLDERVDLLVEDVPDGYTASLHGGDATVSSIYTRLDPPPLELRVRVPDGVMPGDQALTVTATSASGEASLPLALKVADVDTGSVSLTSKYPILSGDSEASYSFDLKLQNDTSKDITFGLQGSGPDGWSVDVRPSGADKAATALVTAGGKTNIKVTAQPPHFVPAGRYVLNVTAEGEGHRAESQLGVEITGSYALGLDTPDGRLSTNIAAGETGPVALILTNTGTAPLSDVKLSASTPKGWEVTFDPESVPAIEPLASVQVTAQVTPAGNAVAGDYVVTMKAKEANADDSLELRTTVETQPLWGAVAIGIIVAAVGGLALVFRRYGRR